MAAEAVREDQQLGAVNRHAADEDATGNKNKDYSTWEIEEVEPDQRAGSPPPNPQGAPAAEDVYVAVGKGGSSMAALSWALRHLARPRSFVYLVHVFPVVASIPTPCKQPSLDRLLLRSSPSSFSPAGPPFAFC